MKINTVPIQRFRRNRCRILFSSRKRRNTLCSVPLSFSTVLILEFFNSGIGSTRMIQQTLFLYGDPFGTDVLKDNLFVSQGVWMPR
ncbi:hypothetical protein MtrunA17_Chr3g0126241 [Medicago truncatula]|uniref:Uncharacterized protein n=1 Tax=Medicago truncatula TaxID=3880 RepID=A0A396IY09_MEDTR|nr:hypothetical protein MtrunA17_Chr3g0126241 [Medicago truncatula]